MSLVVQEYSFLGLEHWNISNAKLLSLFWTIIYNTIVLLHGKQYRCLNIPRPVVSQQVPSNVLQELIQIFETYTIDFSKILSGRIDPLAYMLYNCGLSLER